MSDEQLKEAGISSDLIRMSVGIENIADILDDVRRRLRRRNDLSEKVHKKEKDGFRLFSEPSFSVNML